MMTNFFYAIANIEGNFWDGKNWGNKAKEYGSRKIAQSSLDRMVKSGKLNKKTSTVVEVIVSDKGRESKQLEQWLKI